jgi:hypothetical protein
VERASLRLLLSLTPWIQTDLLSNVVERGSVIVPYGGVADIGLSSYRPFRRRAANLSDLKTSNNRFRAFNLGPPGT